MKEFLMRNTLLALVLSLLALPAAAKNLYIPIAGFAEGANGTFFRTDVRIFNPSTEHVISVTLHFLPRGMDGFNIPGRIVNVQPRATAVLDNVVGDFLQWPTGGLGAIRLDSNTDFSYEFMAESRTYTDSPNPAVAGTYGQFIPALDVETARRKTVITHLAQSRHFDSGFRTNLGIMNPGSETATVIPRLYSADGTLVKEGPPVVVQRMSVEQIALPQMFLTSAEIVDGFATFESDVPVFTYASIVDNRSSDQFFVPGAEDKAGVYPLPGSTN
jgi:hypothetical protein